MGSEKWEVVLATAAARLFLPAIVCPRTTSSNSQSRLFFLFSLLLLSTFTSHLASPSLFRFVLTSRLAVLTLSVHCSSLAAFTEVTAQLLLSRL